MVKIKLNGGLGNQMFQYACARAQALRLNTKLILDTTSFNLPLQTKRVYMLEAFTINAQEERKSNKFKSLLGRLIKKEVVFNEKNFTYDKSINKLTGDISLNGYFQSPKYFEDLRNEIISDFTFKKTIKIPRKITNLIKNTNTVAVHVRRGDYITNSLAVKILGAQPLSYYQKAIKKIESKVKNCQFIIISDDIKWCQENFSKIIDSKDVAFFSKNEFTDLYIMTQVNHNIIANSSFSWWGAWLNNHKNKVVIAPKKWFNDPTYKTTDLFPKDWILV